MRKEVTIYILIALSCLQAGYIIGQYIDYLHEPVPLMTQDVLDKMEKYNN